VITKMRHCMGDTGLCRDTRDISDRMRVHEAKSQMSKTRSRQEELYIRVARNKHSTTQLLSDVGR